MSIFAFVNKGIVDNIIEADEKRSVEVLFPDVELLVEVTDETGAPFIGEPYSAQLGKFAKPQPWPSYVWDAKAYDWKAPKAYPTDGKNYFWDEESKDWAEIDLSAIPFAE